MYLDDSAYFMAIGYANFMGAGDIRGHVFARNYGSPVTIERIMDDWKKFDSNDSAKEFWNKADRASLKNKFYLAEYQDKVEEFWNS